MSEPRKWNIAMLSSVSALEWARKPCWSLSEALLLFRGFVAEGENTSDVLPSMGNAVGKEPDLLNRAILAGQLKPIGKDDNGEDVFAPSDIIAVAEKHQFDGCRFWRGALDHANELAGKPEGPLLAAPANGGNAWTDEEIEKLSNAYTRLGSHQKVADEYTGAGRPITRQRVGQLLSTKSQENGGAKTGTKKDATTIMSSWGK